MFAEFSTLLDLAVQHAFRLPRSCLSKNDFVYAFDYLKKLRSKSLGLAEVPSVRWEDVGGLEEVKQELLQVTILVALLHLLCIVFHKIISSF